MESEVTGTSFTLDPLSPCTNPPTSAWILQFNSYRDGFQFLAVEEGENSFFCDADAFVVSGVIHLDPKLELEVSQFGASGTNTLKNFVGPKLKDVRKIQAHLHFSKTGYASSIYAFKFYLKEVKVG